MTTQTTAPAGPAPSLTDLEIAYEASLARERGLEQLRAATQGELNEATRGDDLTLVLTLRARLADLANELPLAHFATRRALRDWHEGQKADADAEAAASGGPADEAVAQYRASETTMHAALNTQANAVARANQAGRTLASLDREVETLAFGLQGGRLITGYRYSGTAGSVPVYGDA